MMRPMPVVLLAAGFTALGITAYQAVVSSSAGVRIEPEVFIVEPNPIERSEMTVRFRLVNDSGHPVRVVGLETC
ncbi:MAG: hypothetical protein U0746_03790 [Gemmataceae bacterium]